MWFQDLTPTMFVSTDLAARIERAEARLSDSIARAFLARGVDGAFIEQIGTGVAVYAGPSSPINKMIGIGFDGPVDDARLDAVEARFRAKLAPLQAEVATLAEAECAATLTRRGYVLQAFENVLGCEIGDDDRAVPAGVVVGRMADGLGRQWLDVAVTGFLHPDTQGVVPEPLPPREVLERALEAFADVPGFLYYLATIGGEIAGVATMRLDGEVAQLCGATTLPAFRRRGVQTALLRTRLAEARRAGARLAVMTTAPGSKSQENGQRQGFVLLYSRAQLVKEPA